ncbi:Peptidoglycan/LPS O-acetylase OafA/YrhL, contains acyltransferase and SGNH-hydrolase domains [Flavobacterium glycines]|uniref:Acyltransferase n=1 Tax=Flavobacterium glycines TaxID=551990 RepID=A0A1B9DHB9_9FLAO|nr:acyltransferase [Flavobacterium glycines]OCB69083.1 hypothetical protein FBGL_13705 [Flavobacterium glycines]GEL11990.1 acyltransferase [Flavobacterium glycines]SDJ54136.1 Peptidoglycan/LPS O-acetylase OafA/YrhL, contains acyltransferase and SGNH-hydrolase domains [Flavobacterium glycines]
MNNNLNRIPELESLRGIAALSVMLYHYTSFFRASLHYNFSSIFDFQFGHHGVELFFMISGFVIFMSLDRINSVRQFVYKRFLRLYPTYWICLLITLIVMLFDNTAQFDFSLKDKVFNILMFQGFFHVKNIDGSYWSLLPELCFYAMMIFFWRLKIIKDIFLVVLVWLVLMYVVLLRPSLIDVLLNLKFGVFFIIGIMFNLLYKNKKQLYPHIFILLALVSVLFVRDSVEVFCFTSLFVLVFYLLIYQKLSFLNNRIFIFFGEISYPLYLLHQTIGYILIYNLIRYGMPHFASIVLIAIFCIGLSFLVYKYLEQPIINKLR